MSGVIFNGLATYLRLFVACLSTGIAIKIMDDYIDGPWDALIGQKTWAAGLKEAALPYALMALCLGCLADSTWAVTFFWASYAVGMRGDLIRPLALGLTGWQEVALAGVVIYLTCGGYAMFTSWAAIFVMQCIDDLLDQSLDRMSGAHNWATKWGKVEIGISLAIALVVLAQLHPVKLILALVSYALIAFLLRPKHSMGGEAGVDGNIVPS
ncbi:MAG: hypothetical protein GX986_08775 [Firmicutes bacterium]|nr:hypothetical protein [Bacillota bacterium]